MAKQSSEYTLVVKNQQDFDAVVSQFKKIGEVSVGQPTVLRYKNKEIKLTIQDQFSDIDVGMVVNHFKDRLYFIQDRVKDSESGKSMLVYQALYSPYEKYVRYESEFTDIVDFSKYPNTKQCYRFVAIVPDK